MIKGFHEWINENRDNLNQETPEDLQHMLDLGLITPLEFARATRRIDPTGWIDSLMQDLESKHATEPDIWGKPELSLAPYNTLEFTISSDMVNLPEQHYNNPEYRLLSEEQVTVIVYLEGDSHLELIAIYANEDFEEEYGNDEDQYDATWSYDGPVPILRVDDILTIIDQFNDEVDNDTIEDSLDWRHD